MAGHAMPDRLVEVGYQPSPYRSVRYALPEKRARCAMLRMLLSWRASLWKAVWRELAVWLFLYFALSLAYRVAMTEDQRHVFNRICSYSIYYTSAFNFGSLSLFLGFYVSYVSTRWWQMYTTLPYIDTMANALKACTADDGATTKRVIKYCQLCYLVTCRSVSRHARALYPRLEDCARDGWLDAADRDAFEAVSRELPHGSAWWIPIMWSASLLKEARESGAVASDQALVYLSQELLQFRSRCGRMLDFDMIGVPLLYTQVVTVACYSYFVFCLVGRAQYTRPRQLGDPIDLYFPFFSAVEFVLIIGWLKVASKMLDPYGQRCLLTFDATDATFDLIWVLMRNREVGDAIVNFGHPKAAPRGDPWPPAGFARTPEAEAVLCDGEGTPARRGSPLMVV